VDHEAAAMDIVFVLDVLGSDVTPGFGRLLVFVGDVIDRLPLIGRQGTRVGLVTYAEQPRVEIFLDDFDNKDEVQVTPTDFIVITVIIKIHDKGLKLLTCHNKIAIKSK